MIFKSFNSEIFGMIPFSKYLRNGIGVPGKTGGQTSAVATTGLITTKIENHAISVKKTGF
jgi:hypothetical protein